MKNKHLTRHIRLKPDISETHRLEGFIEQICDDFHIYDAYYGNILASNTMALEMLLELEGGQKGHADVYFNKTAKGIYFSIVLGGHFLDFARLYEKIRHMDPNDPEAYDGEGKTMMMIRMLSDEITMNSEKEAMVLTFYVTGINDMLSLQRIQLLEKYYERVHKLTEA